MPPPDIPPPDEPPPDIPPPDEPPPDIPPPDEPPPDCPPPEDPPPEEPPPGILIPPGNPPPLGGGTAVEPALAQAAARVAEMAIAANLFRITVEFCAFNVGFIVDSLVNIYR
jgi:hypothetical protein